MLSLIFTFFQLFFWINFPVFDLYVFDTALSVDRCYYREDTIHFIRTNKYGGKSEKEREKERQRENNFSTVSGLGRTWSDSLEMEKKSGDSFAVEQRAT